MADEQKASENRCEPSAKTRKTALRYVVLAVIVLGFVALAGGFAGTVLGSTWLAQSADTAFEKPSEEPDETGRGDDGDDSETPPEQSQASAEATEEHVHDWTAVYELVDVPAVTHVEHHDAVYGTETAYETVCNSCDAIVTGATREHTAETGHTGFTTNVPITNEVVEQDAYDETVVDAPATVQLVHTSDQCSTCGEVHDVDDEVVQTVNGSSLQQ